MNKTNMSEIAFEQLGMVAGGGVNDNYTPDSIGDGYDDMINGETYDAIAQKIADWLNGDDVRTREISTRDVNDYII